MRIRNCILLAFLCLGEISVAHADVSYIALRIGQDGTIKDIETSLTSDTMAMTVPIVEPDGSITTPEEEEERQLNNEFMEEEIAEEIFQTVQDTQETKSQPEEQQVSPEQEILALPRLMSAIPAAADDEETACTNLGGTWTRYGDTNRCCKDNKAYNNGSWSLLIPQCGCSGTSVYRSLKLKENGDNVCCRAHDQVESVATGGEGIGIVESNSSLCYCPDKVKELDVVEIEDLSFTTTADESAATLFCCAGNYRVQASNEISTSVNAHCECYNDTTKCNKTECEAVGYHWCAGANVCSQGGCDDICPADSTKIETDDGTKICCNNGYRYTYDEEIDSVVRILNTDCGCPNGGTLTNGECCSGGYAWNADDEQYNAIEAVCGCPNEYTLQEDNGRKVCCSNTNQGKFYGMDETDEDDISTAIRACGCAANEDKKAADGGYVCCSNNTITKYTHDTIETNPTLTPKKYCGCATGVYDSSIDDCVPCLNNADCTASGMKRCIVNDEDHTQNECVACRYSSDCSDDTGTCSPSNNAKVCDVNLHVCKTCSEMTNNKRPYRWRGKLGTDTGSCNSCYECTKDTDCATGKICDPNTLTCQTCVLEDADKEPNKNCDEGKYCLPTTSGRICSNCRNSTDCPKGQVCRTEEGICAADCGEIGYNTRYPTECNCSGTTPVWDIYFKKCVTCYDSISGDWTDIGCNTEPANKSKPKGSPQNYDPKQAPITAQKPVCWVKYTTDAKGRVNGRDNGTCVECVTNDECPGEKYCTTDHTCTCPDGKPNFVQSTGECLTCGANYGASSGNYKCTNSLKPLCKSGECTCKDNYDAEKKDGDGKCPVNAPVCDKEGSCKCTNHYVKDKENACPKSKPICNTTTHMCEACETGKTYDEDQKKCIDCKTSKDCGPTQYCNNGTCTNCALPATKTYTCSGMSAVSKKGEAKKWFEFERTHKDCAYKVYFAKKTSFDDAFYMVDEKGKVLNARGDNSGTTGNWKIPSAKSSGGTSLTIDSDDFRADPTGNSTKIIFYIKDLYGGDIGCTKNRTVEIQKRHRPDNYSPQ